MTSSSPNDSTNNAKPFQPPLGAQFDVLLAPKIVVTNLLIRGPIWGDGLTLLASIISLSGGNQALRLTATNMPPPLAIQKNGVTYQVVYPTNYQGFNIQRSPDLRPTNWTDLASGTNRVLIVQTNVNTFFRLKQH